MKNTSAIDKIIRELSLIDYKAAYKKYPEQFKAYNAGKIQRRPHGYYQFSYSLRAETAEAVGVKNEYLSGEISEETYKSYCLRYNLR